MFRQLFYFFVFLAALGLRCGAPSFSSRGTWALELAGSALGLRCGAPSFSSRGAWALELAGSVVVGCGLLVVVQT